MTLPAWWSWPFMFRLDGASVPRWFDISYNLPNNTVSTITVLGNPVVWWVGFALMLILTARAIHARELLSNLRSRISKLSADKRISIRGNGWESPAIFIVVVFFFSWFHVLIGRQPTFDFLPKRTYRAAITYFIVSTGMCRERLLP
jgi:hypothetical protein